MKFDHLVPVNDPSSPPIAPLSAGQVWRGLVLRAENPLLFVHGLDGFTLLDRHGDVLYRDLRFGKLAIRDRVTFQAPTRVRHDIEASAEVPGATLIISIEQASDAPLFVRFDYRTRPVAGAPPVEEIYQGFVKKAYVEADVDSVRMIRQLAAQGRL